MTVDYDTSLSKYDSWIAEREGHSVGFLLMQFEQQSAIIFSIAVLPSAQGQGAGGALLSQGESLAKEKGYKAIRLYTNERMVRNLEIYRSKGYVETSRETHGDTSIVHMEKSLQ